MVTKYLPRIVVAGMVVLVSAIAVGQEPRNTLWSFLGIPQAVQAGHGALFNRKGNHPALEKKPPLKGLADAANLKSDVPAIKKAAEIKKAEDLKPQKIKAVKYLAQIGCGCYDTDGSVTDALVAAMDDCTEEVRLATIEAITEAASGQCCAHCGATCCCNEKISEQLFKMAYELDDAGCYLEKSARVRQAAARALAVCCPGRGPITVEDSEYQPELEESRETGEEMEAPTPAPTPAPAPEGNTDASLVPTSAPAPLVTVPRQDTQAIDSLRDSGEPLGVIIHADPKGRLAHVHFEQQSLLLSTGTCVTVYKKLPDGARYHGEAEVVKASSGAATVRPASTTPFADVQPGDLVIAGCAPVRVH